MTSYSWHGRERQAQRGLDRAKINALVKANEKRIQRAGCAVELYSARLVVVAAPCANGAKVITAYECGR